MQVSFHKIKLLYFITFFNDIKNVIFLIKYFSEYSFIEQRCSEKKECINIRECPALLKMLLQSNLNSETIQNLRDHQCGFRGKDPLVCCPKKSPPTSVTDLTNNPLLPENCGRDLSQRIFGGTTCDIDEFTWLALLEYTKSMFQFSFFLPYPTIGF